MKRHASKAILLGEFQSSNYVKKHSTTHKMKVQFISLYILADHGSKLKKGKLEIFKFQVKRSVKIKHTKFIDYV